MSDYNFLQYEFMAAQGDLVKVTLAGNAANVMLLDDVNFELYRTRMPYQYRGGYYERSPVVLGVPATGHWRVVVDLGGRPGRVNASVQVVSRQQPVSQ